MASMKIKNMLKRINSKQANGKDNSIKFLSDATVLTRHPPLDLYPYTATTCLVLHALENLVNCSFLPSKYKQKQEIKRRDRDFPKSVSKFWTQKGEKQDREWKRSEMISISAQLPNRTIAP